MMWILMLLGSGLCLQGKMGSEEILEMTDLTIKTPLQAGKRFLGWYVDGQWKVEDKRLKFLSFKNSNFLITNNLLLNSKKMEYTINTDIQKGRNTDQNPDNRMDYQEVIAFSIQNDIFPISEFSENKDLFYVNGKTFFLITYQNQGYLFMRNYYTSKTIDFKEISSIRFMTQRNYCKVDYLGNHEFQFKMDFESRKLEVYYDGQICIQSDLSEQIYRDPKTTITIQGMSRGENLIEVVMDNLSVKKQVFVEKYKQPQFTDNYSSLYNSILEFEKDSNKNSLFYIIREQARIDDEIDETQNLTELIANRTDQILDAFDKKDTIEKRDISDHFEDSMKEQSKNLENMITTHHRIFDNFASLTEQIQQTDKLFDVLKSFEDIDKHLEELDEIMMLSDYEELIKELRDYKSHSTETQTNEQIDYVFEKLGLSGSFKLLSMILVLLTIVLLSLIFKRLKENTQLLKF